MDTYPEGINMSDGVGRYPLHHAALGNSVTILQTLLKANPNIIKYAIAIMTMTTSIVSNLCYNDYIGHIPPLGDCLCMWQPCTMGILQ
jgi:hypothetical protein